MAALYFHIPFCRKVCAYCDFLRSVNTTVMAPTLEGMHKELDQRHSFISDRAVRTVYFGGGTPSLLHPAEIQSFIEHAYRLFDCSQLTEITVEVNPDDVTEEYVAALGKTEVNRISIGIQSLNDRELKLMSRRHDADSAVRAVKRLQDAGYDNISADIIFGVPGFGADVLSETLRGILDLNVQHVSAYHLSIEHGTRFGTMLERGELHEIDDEKSEAEFRLIHDALSESGFEHYEVSNYALLGYRSKHNCSYWDSTQYLGIGPGAHSYNGHERVWCEQLPVRYVEGPVFTTEELSARDRVNEYLMTSLRTVSGICFTTLRGLVDSERDVDRVKALARQFVERGWMKEENGTLAILPEHFMVSDLIIRTLFFDN